MVNSLASPRSCLNGPPEYKFRIGGHSWSGERRAVCISGNWTHNSIARNSERACRGNLGGKLKRSKIVCVLIAPMLLLACGGPAHEAEPAPSGPTHVATVAEAGPTLAAAEAQSVLEASVKDRTADALATPSPDGPSLDEARSSGKFKAARERAKPLVAARKVGLQGFGFHYTSASTTVQVAEITGTASKATVKFDEYGTQYLASDTTGPSDVPEQYRVQETATFIMTDLGWVLDEVLPDDGQFGLPFSMVDPRLPPEA
jgi:hypothetical protein